MPSNAATGTVQLSAVCSQNIAATISISLTVTRTIFYTLWGGGGGGGNGVAGSNGQSVSGSFAVTAGQTLLGYAGGGGGGQSGKENDTRTSRGVVLSRESNSSRMHV
jgi:hypothetical protein